MRRGIAILFVLTAIAGCGGPVDDRAQVAGASIVLEHPAGRQYDGGLIGGASASPAQQLYLLLMMQDTLRKDGSSPDPLPGLVDPVGSSPDPLPGLCNDEGDCVPQPLN
jgi:hypothetical protein